MIWQEELESQWFFFCFLYSGGTTLTVVGTNMNNANVGKVVLIYDDMEVVCSILDDLKV